MSTKRYLALAIPAVAAVLLVLFFVFGPGRDSGQRAPDQLQAGAENPPEAETNPQEPSDSQPGSNVSSVHEDGEAGEFDAGGPDSPRLPDEHTSEMALPPGGDSTVPAASEAETSEPEGPGNGDVGDRIPVYWRLGSPTFPAYVDDFIEMTSDFTRVWNGSASVRVRARQPVEPAATAGVFQFANAEPWLSQRLRFTGYLQVESMSASSPASAMIWIRADDSSGRVVAFQSTQGRFRMSESSWHEVSIVIDIPSDASVLNYGASLFGSGTVWVDSLTLSAVGDEVSTTAQPFSGSAFNRVPQPDEVLGLPANLDFEETRPISE